MSEPTWAVLDDGWVAARGINEYDAIFRCVDERNATLAVKILNIKDARLAAALAAPVEPQTSRHVTDLPSSDGESGACNPVESASPGREATTASVEPQGPTSEEGEPK